MPITGVETRMASLLRTAGFVMVLMSPVADASADCNLPRSGTIASERADVVFRGRVRQAQILQRPGWWGQILTFDVSRVWKGDGGPTFVLHDDPTSAEDPSFEAGMDISCFATKNPPPVDPRLNIGGPSYDAPACSGTVSTLYATRYLIDLGAGRPPAQKSRPPHPRTLQ
jgi:hypothetical protein